MVGDIYFSMNSFYIILNSTLQMLNYSSMQRNYMSSCISNQWIRNWSKIWISHIITNSKQLCDNLCYYNEYQKNSLYVEFKGTLNRNELRLRNSGRKFIIYMYLLNFQWFKIELGTRNWNNLLIVYARMVYIND